MNYEFMYAAYSVAWVIIFSYLFLIDKKQSKLKKEIEFLKQLDK
ncbi:CcmD family protein [Bacillus salipaludis]|uniref:CcmD family protein n=1 Tax=Bacillus salipaludis TaxID=2547811 RepID=A0A4R5VP00_9BACI|nr:CcmD family protein [Bacillus salipaludis]MDQ6599605.1 CcmD family protein [Bacillus salipaludis]TDK60128.1 CcmD family protein [Bacillus salipaludis]